MRPIAKVCTYPGCGKLVYPRAGAPSRCERHQYPKDMSRRWSPFVRQRAGESKDDAVLRTARWSRLRKLVLARDPVCCACRRAPSRHVDHIVARRAGGTDAMSNLQGLCVPCHSAKTAREIGARYRASKQDTGEGGSNL